MQRRFILSLLLMSMSGLLFISCSKETKRAGMSHAKGEGMPADWKFTLPKGDPVEGRKVFVEMECHKCHEIKGENFPAVTAGEKGVGPELSQMAGMHPVEFFAESIINPNAVIDEDDRARGYLGEDCKSKMPDYNDILTVKQAADLAAYLNSLTGGGHKVH